uniref:G129 RS Superfamily M precursor conopeptide n=1 Tax=Conus geographus TaxID=6491 RepID=X5IA35_CONGE|nr:G129_RS_Superfamily_M_precursor_conopeptide [Conus geographus]
MMSKLGVFLTICLLLFPITALPLDEDQLAERMQDDNSAANDPWFNPVKRCCEICIYGCSGNCCG